MRPSSLFLGLFSLCALLSAVSGEIINKSVKRQWDLTRPIARSQVDITFTDEEASIKTYQVAIPLYLDERLALLTVKGDKNVVLDVVKGVRDEAKHVQLYTVKLNSPVAKGDEGNLKVFAHYTRVMNPYPAEIAQNEDQLVLFIAQHLFMSPYPTTTQSTRVKLPSPRVEQYSEVPPVNLKGSILTYGPYENTEAYGSISYPKSLQVHFKNHAPFMTMTNLVKEIEVSLWGRVSTEEVVDLANTGAVLKGGFSRYDYMMVQATSASFRQLTAVLPKDAVNVYYRDQIGNITTSRMRQTPSRTELELNARFPLFGGWKTQYYLGYSVPTQSVLFRTGETYKLEMDFGTCIDGAAVDDLTLKIILPEGARNIKVDVPFHVDQQSQTNRQTYLDTAMVGRPVVILQKKNVVPQHNVPFTVTFEYPSQFIYREPLLLIGGYFAFFVVCMILFRLDLSLTKSKAPEKTKVDATRHWSRALGSSLRYAPSLSTDDYCRMTIESRAYDAAVQTPLIKAHSMSEALKNTILLKREDMQPVFSFKIRGAYNKMAHLPPSKRETGVVCCSAGNHAQGVALSAKKLGIQATIVMPLATPQIKVKAVQQHGGDNVTVILHGNNFDEAAAEAKRIEQVEGRTMILPFDDPHVIAGQGTIGMEILQQTTGQPLDAVFLACGGGGMLAGVANWVKHFRPSVKVIGVEAADAAGMTASLAAGKRVELDQVGLFADGAAVKLVGEETFRICQQHVDEMVTVTTDDICAAIKTGFNDTRVVLEPAGALAIAGVDRYIKEKRIQGGTYCVVTSGANMDFTRLRFVSERADGTETLISVKIDERPGSFERLHSYMDAEGVRITEFSYRYSEVDNAHICMSFQSISREQSDRVVARLNQVGYEVMDLRDNELAKVHTRHLAGGKSVVVGDERLYRFEFADKPGALKAFLTHMNGGSTWNISLFHYRNHGADIGRVLVGFQVPPQDEARFHEYLTAVSYHHVDETNNPVYKQFLARTA
ncbi:l-threonine ammonia-lyase [Thraustotheca clavata]|uniref:Threonine dehydratase n=1 Tax=Thraustotheca clavata TaxID=74557 RepID=A0A1V9ZXD0_9STRA|nr:l-threonine ammonia-lyase [Thraustotheca clavata]